MQSLTTTESARLKELESLIDSNVSLVGKALFEIRESKLYKQTHGTFEDYCQERFTMSRNYINKQIKAAETVGNLETIGFQTVGNLGTIVPKPSSPPVRARAGGGSMTCRYLVLRGVICQ